LHERLADGIGGGECEALNEIDVRAGGFLHANLVGVVLVLIDRHRHINLRATLGHIADSRIEINGGGRGDDVGDQRLPEQNLLIGEVRRDVFQDGEQGQQRRERVLRDQNAIGSAESIGSHVISLFDG